MTAAVPHRFAHLYHTAHSLHVPPTPFPPFHYRYGFALLPTTPAFVVLPHTPRTPYPTGMRTPYAARYAAFARFLPLRVGCTSRFIAFGWFVLVWLRLPLRLYRCRTAVAPSTLRLFGSTVTWLLRLPRIAFRILPLFCVLPTFVAHLHPWLPYTLPQRPVRLRSSTDRCPVCCLRMRDWRLVAAWLFTRGVQLGPTLRQFAARRFTTRVTRLPHTPLPPPHTTCLRYLHPLRYLPYLHDLHTYRAYVAYLLPIADSSAGWPLTYYNPILPYNPTRYLTFIPGSCYASTPVVFRLFLPLRLPPHRRFSSPGFFGCYSLLLPRFCPRPPFVTAVILRWRLPDLRVSFHARTPPSTFTTPFGLPGCCRVFVLLRLPFVCLPGVDDTRRTTTTFKTYGRAYAPATHTAHPRCPLLIFLTLPVIWFDVCGCCVCYVVPFPTLRSTFSHVLIWWFIRCR